MEIGSRSTLVRMPPASCTLVIEESNDNRFIATMKTTKGLGLVRVDPAIFLTLADVEKKVTKPPSA